MRIAPYHHPLEVGAFVVSSERASRREYHFQLSRFIDFPSRVPTLRFWVRRPFEWVGSVRGKQVAEC
jgi:hypothetical protein